jgi:hypothetical protein
MKEDRHHIHIILEERMQLMTLAGCAGKTNFLPSRPPRKQTSEFSFSCDALASLVEEYAKLVEGLLDPRPSTHRLQFAYSRILGVRGNLCRLCPKNEMLLAPKGMLNRWIWAETNFRNYLHTVVRVHELVDVVQIVEEAWADSVERYVQCLSCRLTDADIAAKIGLLKGIDTVAMHLAQREILEISHAFAIPAENTQDIKLRVRLVSLCLNLHRVGFTTAMPAIQSYRETFRIDDPSAYPWWFIDQRLTEKQLNWTYRRMPSTELGWRF